MTEKSEAGGNKAVVVGSSRRFVHLLDERSGSFIRAQSSSKAVDVTVGDLVTYDHRRGEAVVLEILPAKNYLSRSYRQEMRKIAANVDQLLIVAAVGPLFNAFFIDRIMSVAACQAIPFTLVINKADLGIEDTKDQAQIYEKLGIPVMYISATERLNLEALEQLLADPQLRIVALSGNSGVGKSTILNQLIPGIELKTAEVSERTGQGRQTTTQAYGYSYERGGAPRLVVIDLPGVQNFGVTHLSRQDVAESFPEFVERAYDCEFGNCSHIAETNCAIKKALDEGHIAPQRYDSYVRMVAEIDEARPY